MDVNKLAIALRLAADALEGVEAVADVATLPAAAPAEPKPRGRGRPPKVEAPVVEAPTPVAAPDPFNAPAVAAVTHTLDDVRSALMAVQAAVDTAKVVDLLKTHGGVANISALTADKFAAVIAAAKAVTPEPVAPAVADPFATEEPAKAAPAVTLQDVQAAVVRAQKRTGTDTVQKVVMKHGGVANVAGQPAQPSLKAVPPANFAACIAELNGLPTTK